MGTLSRTDVDHRQEMLLDDAKDNRIAIFPYLYFSGARGGGHWGLFWLIGTLSLFVLPVRVYPQMFKLNLMVTVYMCI